MPDVTIIADDLTGAADCGIAFAAAGLSTFVAWADLGAPASVQVLAIDLDSRALAPAAAAERAHAAARRACRRGGGILYQKIDSTLRGNVGEELAAIRAGATRAGESPVAIIAPAFPKLGRTTRNGRVHVHGVPLEQTEVWRGSGKQGSGDLAEMLRLAGISAQIAQNPRDVLRLAGRGAQAIVCDAEEDDDLRRVAEAGAQVARPVVWVGSAGLARHLPAALGMRAGAMRPSESVWPSGPVLTLIGSRSTISREQARLLAAEHEVRSLILDPEHLLAGEGSAGWSRANAALGQALDSGCDVLLLIGPGESSDPRHAAALGRLAAPYAAQLGGLVATGGDTAKGVMTAMGARGMFLVGEVEPGVPLGIADLPRPIPLITKAGAFGSPPILQRCRAVLKRRAAGAF